jgi:PBP1b-binding outer membrane lipoprotein LpoB
MKFLAVVSVFALVLAGCASSTPRAVTVSDLYEAKLAEVRAENAKLHNDLVKVQNDPCFKSVAGAYDHAVGWVKQEYADHTK